MRLPARPNYSTFNPLVLQAEARCRSYVHIALTRDA
jgi:hypothetical protein